MQREPAVYLWDAERAAGLAIQFVEGRIAEDLSTDLLLRAAVERQVQVVGEALNQLTRLDPTYVTRIPDLPRIIGLRNILVHGYAMVDLDRLWRVVQEDVPPLRSLLQALLREVTK